MMNGDWKWCLNKDDSLYFFPIGHTVEGSYKIHFELSGTCNLRVSDADLQGKAVLLFEYFDEDDDRPARIDTLEATTTTIEQMTTHLNSIDSPYHEPIYRIVYEWAVKLFY